MTANRRRGLIAGVLALSAIVAIAMVAGQGDDETEPVVGPVAPLTGLRIDDADVATRPALAVKVDNVSAGNAMALPQSGLVRADVVLEEIVEGDITRLIAVYHSRSPGRVGPVRSARTTDVHLLPQLGTTLLAWSGGNDGVVRAVRDSPAIIDLGFDRATDSYARDPSRRAPHNLYVEADELWDLAPGDLPAPDPLFTFGEADRPPPPSARPASGADITWGGGPGASPVTWRWEPELELYVRTQRGEPHVDVDGEALTARNVVILLTPYGQSPADTRSPEALTVGSGDALVLTNGTVVPGRWDRPAEDVPAALVDIDQQVIKLTPGQSWIQLPRPGEVTIID